MHIVTTFTLLSVSWEIATEVESALHQYKSFIWIKSKDAREISCKCENFETKYANVNAGFLISRISIRCVVLHVLGGR